MKHTKMQFYTKLKWQVYRFFDQIGLLGLGALVLMLLSFFLFFISWNVLQAKISSANVTDVPSKSIATLEAESQVTDSKMLSLAIKRFPNFKDKANVFNIFMDYAKEQELSLDVVNYKTRPLDHALPFSQTSMEFSVYANYPQVHEFMNHVMMEMPFVAIEHLSLNRLSDEDETVEARIKLLFTFAIN